MNFEEYEEEYEEYRESKNRSKKIQSNLKPREYELLLKLAAKANCNVSDYIRELVLEKIKMASD